MGDNTGRARRSATEGDHRTAKTGRKQRRKRQRQSKLDREKDTE